MKTTIQQAMSELLKSLGFNAMSADVLNETDIERPQKYARVIVKNSPASMQNIVAQKLTVALKEVQS